MLYLRDGGSEKGIFANAESAEALNEVEDWPRLCGRSGGMADGLDCHHDEAEKGVVEAEPPVVNVISLFCQLMVGKISWQIFPAKLLFANITGA